MDFLFYRLTDANALEFGHILASSCQVFWRPGAVTGVSFRFAKRVFWCGPTAACALICCWRAKPCAVVGAIMFCAETRSACFLHAERSAVLAVNSGPTATARYRPGRGLSLRASFRSRSTHSPKHSDGDCPRASEGNKIIRISDFHRSRMGIRKGLEYKVRGKVALREGSKFGLKHAIFEQCFPLD
jgi:hypothetical protein